MICDQCGKPCRIRVFYPHFVRENLVGAFKNGKWICTECLKLSKEQPMNTRN